MGSDLSNLRKIAQELEEDDPFELDSAAVGKGQVRDDKIFGLNPVERMFLSIGLFLVVSVLSFMLLLLTDSIVLP